MLVLLASPWKRWRPGEYLLVPYGKILYATSNHSPGRQRHLGEANKANI